MTSNGLSVWKDDQGGMGGNMFEDMKNGIDWQAFERHYGLELKMLLKLKYETATTSTPETGAIDIS